MTEVHVMLQILPGGFRRCLTLVSVGLFTASSWRSWDQTLETCWKSVGGGSVWRLLWSLQYRFSTGLRLFILWDIFTGIWNLVILISYKYINNIYIYQFYRVPLNVLFIIVEIFFRDIKPENFLIRRNQGLQCFI